MSYLLGRVPILYGVNFSLLLLQVNALLLSIRDEVQSYRENFQPVFRP